MLSLYNISITFGFPLYDNCVLFSGKSGDLFIQESSGLCCKCFIFALHYVALSHWSYVSNGISPVKSAIKRAKIICYKSQLLTD